MSERPPKAHWQPISALPLICSAGSLYTKVIMGFHPPAPHEYGPVWPVLFRTVTAIF